MGKKKQVQKQSEPEEDIDDSDESVKPKRKSKAKKQTKKTPAKSAVKQQPKQKPASTSRKQTKTTKAKPADMDEEDQEKINKKKDFLPGQKFQTPQQDDGARTFYTSLYSQNPESQMAKRYCLQYGLLQRDEAIKYAKELKKQK